MTAVTHLSTNLALDTSEAAMQQRGNEKYLRRQTRLEERGAASERDDYDALLWRFFEPVADRVADAFSEPSRNPLLNLLRVIEPNNIAFIAMRTVMNKLTTEDDEKKISTSIGKQLNQEAKFNYIKGEDPKLLQRLHAYAQQKLGSERHQAKFILNTAQKTDIDPATGAVTRQGMVLKDWSVGDASLIGTWLIDVMADAGLITKETVHRDPKNPAHRTVLVSYSPESLEVLREATEKGDYVVLPECAPMTDPPNPWVNMYGGGYQTLKYSLIQGRVQTVGDMPKVYQAVNYAQSTGWRFNTEMLDIVQHLRKSHTLVGKLPRTDHLPKVERKTTEEWDAMTKDQRDEHSTHISETASTNRQVESDLAYVNMVLGQAERLREHDCVYLPHYLDWRGRMYCKPLLNPQQAGYVRSMFEFASVTEPVNERGAMWLGIQVATLWDGDERLSKQPFPKRYEWAEDNIEFLRAIVADPYNNTEWHKADKPFMFLRTAMDWVGLNDAWERGEHFVSRMPISIDGTCSGIQHYSAMLRDRETGAKVNLIDNAKPADVYQDVADVVLAMLHADTPSPERDWWLDQKIDRKLVKKPTMTYGYSSGENGFMQHYLHEVTGPKKAPSPVKTAGYLAKLTRLAVQEVLTSVYQGMSWLQLCAKLLAKEGKPVTWTTPSGFRVTQQAEKVESTPPVETVLGGPRYGKKRYTKSVPRGKRHIDAGGQHRGIGPNFVHSMDASHLALTILKAAEMGVTNFALIHDSFGTSPNEADAMYAAVRLAFVEMYDQNDPLTSLYCDVLDALEKPKNKGELTEPPCFNTLKIEEVKDATYAFA